MPRHLWQAACVLAIALFLNQATASRVKVIYGDDNRLDYYQVSNPNLRSLADSTVALIRTASLETQGESTLIRTTSYGQSMGLCASEPFYSQETAAFCSGFLVAPDVIVTAGHCIRSAESCQSTKFVFGFKLDQADAQPRSVGTSQVYGCKHLVHSIAEPNGEDFAVVVLDRQVQDHSALKFRSQGRPAPGEELVVVGHPAGLPMKVSGGANVREVKEHFLVANLDTYGGNSGSAVFNASVGYIEGILVRGELDYIYQNGCRLSNRCADTGCRGEDVTLFERVLPYLPKNN